MRISYIDACIVSCVPSCITDQWLSPHTCKTGSFVQNKWLNISNYQAVIILLSALLHQNLLEQVSGHGHICGLVSQTHKFIPYSSDPPSSHSCPKCYLNSYSVSSHPVKIGPELDYPLDNHSDLSHRS